MSKIKTIAPWFVAIGIFAYLFHVYPPHKIWDSLSYVRLGTFIPFAVGYFIFIYLADVFAMTRVLKRFGFDVPMKSLLPARGVTYLIMVLNYGAAQAGFAYYLKKTHRIPIWEALSIFFFIAVIDLYWVISLAFVGSFFQDYAVGGTTLRNFIWGLALIAYCLFILNYLFWRGPLYQKLEQKKWKILQWIRQKDIFRLFKEARLGDYFKLALLRTPIHVSLIISMFIVLRTFDVFIPFLKILGNMPLVFLVGTIPITPGGLGTANVAIVELLTPYVKSPLFDSGVVKPAELLFAATILWMFSNYLLKIIFGVFCLKTVSKDLFQSTPQTKEQVASLGQNFPL